MVCEQGGDRHASPWLAARAAGMINRLKVDVTGRTAHSKWKCKDFKRDVAEFGEAILYLELDSVGKNKYEPRWHDGIFLGARDKTGEILVGTDHGMVKARDSKRKLAGQGRWNKERALAIIGVPWEPTPGRMGDIEVRPCVRVQDDEEPPQASLESTGGPLAQRGRIYRSDAVREGPTPGCRGCRADILNEKVHGHTDKCRDRQSEARRGE